MSRGDGGVGGIFGAGAGVAAAAGDVGAGLTVLGGTSGLSFVGAAVAGAIGGAVGSLASQVAGNLMNMQSGINWNGVALGALGGAVSGGVGELSAAPAGAAAGTANSFVSTLWGSNIAGYAAEAAVDSAVTQGIGVVTHLEPHFQWSQVADAAVVSGAAQGLAVPENLSGQTAGIGTSLEGAANQIVGGVVAKELTGGQESYASIEGDAFGNALGDSIAGQMQQPSGPANAQLQSAQNANADASADAMLAKYQNSVIQYPGGPSFNTNDSLNNVPLAANGVGVPATMSDAGGGGTFGPITLPTVGGGSTFITVGGSQILGSDLPNPSPTPSVQDLSNQIQQLQSNIAALQYQAWVNTGNAITTQLNLNSQITTTVSPVDSTLSNLNLPASMGNIDYIQENALAQDQSVATTPAQQQAYYDQSDAAMLGAASYQNNAGAPTNPVPASPAAPSGQSPLYQPFNLNFLLAGTGTGLTIGANAATTTMYTPIQAEGPYGSIRGVPGYQAHHLNQNAVYQSVIPQSQGQSINIQGNAINEAGSAHYEAHASLENWWNQYRRVDGVEGPLFGQFPTNAQYGGAAQQSLIDAGISPADAARVSDIATQQRIAAGLLENADVPKIPGRTVQTPTSYVNQGLWNARAAATGLKWVGGGLAVAGAGMDGYSLGTQINASLNTGNWQNTGLESARIAGGWTGAWAFGEAGASGGAVLGAFTGPLAPIAIPAFSLIGGIGGGIAGYWLGGQAGQNVYNYTLSGQ